jgi:lactate dehydrogenase-like 2-hydroxyacid dehydrogenase
MKKKILITYNLPREGFVELMEEFELIFPETDFFSKIEVLEKIGVCDALLSMFNFVVDREIIDAGKELKIISNFGVGFNNVDFEYAREKGVMVTNTPDPVVEPTAEMAFALMLATARRVAECDRKLRDAASGLKWGVMENLGVGLHGKTLGIVGLGRIGKSIARRAEAFGMRVVYHNRRETEAGNATYCSTLDELLCVSDFVSLNVPLTEETFHLINADALKKMKTSAILINTARGPVVDELALAYALENKIIRAAGLDVFENEPSVCPPLLTLDNVVLAPHNGTATIDARIDMSRFAARNIINFFKGEKITCVW